MVLREWTSARPAAAVSLAVMGALGAGCALARSGLGPDGEATGGAPTTTTSGQGGQGNEGGSGAAAGAGATGGTGGCGSPTDCPGVDTDCRSRSCSANECGFADAAVGAPCSDDGGEVCDGAGACVKNDGSACGDAGECLSGLCVDDVCCASSCEGLCESCAVAGSEGACTPLPAATDPSAECAGVCDGAGACADGTYQWAKRFGDGSYQSARSVAFDSQGNVVVAGWFGGAIDLGVGSLTSAGDTDGFVAKVAPNGTTLWSKRFGGLGEDAAWAVAVGPGDTVVVTGWFEQIVDFGGGSLTSAGARDLFTLTLDSAGNHLQSQRFGGAWSEWAYGVAVASDGSVVLVGEFNSANLSFGGPALTKLGEAVGDGFVAKLTSGGQHVWSTSYGSDGTRQLVYDVVLDASGNAFVVGRFAGSMDLMGSEVASAGDSDIFAVAFSPAGAKSWAVHAGGASYDAPYRAAVTPSGDLLFVGEFDGSLDFGTGTLTSAGGWDSFLVQLDGLNGAAIRAERYGDGAYQGSWGLGVDARGNVVHAGENGGTADFGGGALTSAGGVDVYLVKHAVTGEPLWSHGFGDASNQYLNDAAVSAAGQVAIVGEYEGTVDFGGGGLLSLGGGDGYVALFSP